MTILNFQKLGLSYQIIKVSRYEFHQNVPGEIMSLKCVTSFDIKCQINKLLSLLIFKH